jgi:hypothetical protein
LLLACAGCKDEETIQQYTVSFKDREPILLRVAGIPHKDEIWFFRISGPESLVKAQKEAFEAFVKSATFDDKKEPPLQVTEPKDWKKDPPVEGRFGLYRLPTEPRSIEVKVSSLPAKQFTILPNLHRWQKELNLPAAEEKDIPKYVRRDKLNGKDVMWFEMEGLALHRTTKVAEPQAQAKGRRFPMLAPPAAGNAAQVPFKYEIPKGWDKKQPRDKFTAVLFQVGEKDPPTQVSLTPLPAGVDAAANINRWRAQVKLPEIDGAEAVKAASRLKIADVVAYYVDVENPQGPEHSNRILGVIIPQENTTWVVKMWGPRESVGQHKNAFETFVKSFQLDAR